MVIKNIPIKLPRLERNTASVPLPFFNNSCPGKSEFSVSGHPKKTDGIKSVNVWAILREQINTSKFSFPIKFVAFSPMAIIIVPIKLICNPGIRPVIVPKITPIKR